MDEQNATFPVAAAPPAESILDTIRPLANRLVVKRRKAEEKTPGGLFIPESAQKKSEEAEVLAVGPGIYLDDGRRVPVDVKVGDTILISKYAGAELQVRGETVHLIREDDIVGQKVD